MAQQQHRLWRATHHKRWMYVLTISPSHLIAAAVVHLGYAATAFVSILDRSTRSLLFDRSFFTVPQAAHVSDECEQGCDVSFRARRCRISLARPAGSDTYTFAAHLGRLHLSLLMQSRESPCPIAVVSPVPDGGLVNVTEKRVLMPTRGLLVRCDHATRIESAVSGLDYTQGYLARRTTWRWAFGMGQATDGTPVAFNLVDGFNGGRECAVWIGDELIPTESARFDFARARPLAPWQISTPDGRLELNFRGDAMHTEQMNLGVIRSRFVQPLGVFSGSISRSTRGPITVDQLAGVVESQDVLW